MALLAVAGIPPAAGQAGCGDARSGYSLHATLDEVRESSDSEAELEFRRDGDLSCTAVASLRLVEPEGDFTSPATFTMTLGPGASSTSAYFQVLDDREPEPAESFAVRGDLRVTSSDGAGLDYPKLFDDAASITIQASDGYKPGLAPRIAFADTPANNRTFVRENGSWFPRFTVSFPPADDTIVTLQLDNGTCAECRLFASRVMLKGGERTVTLLGTLQPEFWSPQDRLSEPPEAACLRISAPGMRAGPPRALVMTDDDNRTRPPVTNRTLLRAAGLSNATIDHLQDPCGHPINAPTMRTSSGPRSAPPKATTPTLDADPGVPSDSPLLQKQESPGAALAALLAALGLAARMGARRAQR